MDTTPFKKLMQEWGARARMHRRCQQEREEEDGSDEHDEEWLMHDQAADIYDRCADELKRALATTLTPLAT